MVNKSGTKGRRPCSVQGCPKSARRRGWCPAHYMRWRKTGDPGPAGDLRRKPKLACDVDTCGRVASTRGWCDPHYRAWLRHGDPTYRLRAAYTHGTGFARENGYLLRWAPNHPLSRASGYVPEHRYVIYEAGVSIPDGYHVHHINHDRADNRLENLAVMSPSEHSSHHNARRRSAA